MLNNKLCVVTIMYIIGIILGVYLQFGISLFVLITIIIIIIIFNKKKYVIFIVVILISNIYVSYLNNKYDSQYVDVTNAHVVGTIIEKREEKEYKWTFAIKINSINGDEKYKNTKLYLVVKKSKKCATNLNFGDLVEFDGEYSRPNSQTNYKGDNYSFFIRTQKTYGTLETRASVIKLKDKNNVNIIDFIINNISEKIINNLKLLLSDKNEGLAIGLLLGNKKYISDDMLKLFKECNLYHILAISGMHISYIVLGISTALKKFNKVKVNLFLVVFLIFFMKLTGMTPSVMRATVMTIIILMGNILCKKCNQVINISCAALIILIINPYNLFELGFLFSFSGTLGIIIFSNKLQNDIFRFKIKNKILLCIVDTIFVSISANLMIFPIMIYKFNTISFVFLVSNLLISPVLGITIILCFIVAIFSFFSFKFVWIFSKILDLLLTILVKLVEISHFFSKFDILIGTPNILTIILIYFIIFLIFFLLLQKNLIIKIYRFIIKMKIKNHAKYIFKMNYRKIVKVLAIIIIILVIIIRLYDFYNPILNIYFIDVSQGDSTLIVTPNNKSILIDGGGSELGDFDVGEKVLLPYLLDRKILKLDYVMITHFDSDHCKGIFTVLKKLNVKNVIISRQGESSENYKDFLSIINDKKINVIEVSSGNKIVIDNYTYIDIIWPSNTLIGNNVLNNNSIVCKFVYNNFSILFTGDIEEIAESEILAKYSKNLNSLNSTFIKIAHHGSKSSTSEEFIKNIKANVALIGVGANNTFGHPNDGVMNRLKAYGMQVYRTDLNGEIEITVNKKGKYCIKTKK